MRKRELKQLYNLARKAYHAEGGDYEPAMDDLVVKCNEAEWAFVGWAEENGWPIFETAERFAAKPA